MTEKEIKGILRIMGTDIKGGITLKRGLRKIKGLSFMMSNAVCKASGVDPNKKIGALESKEVEKIESILKDPEFPLWMLNRRKDPETGENLHIVGAKLDLRGREDVNMLRRIRSYRGIRHELGLPVRGQRTRSSFRKGKAVGVSKKRLQEKKSGKK